PRLLVICPPVLRAIQLFGESRVSVRHVASSLGYAKPEVLLLHLKTLTGLRPRDIRDRSAVLGIPRLIAPRLKGLGTGNNRQSADISLAASGFVAQPGEGVAHQLATS